MRTAPAAFIARLQNDRTFGKDIWGDVLGDLLFEGRKQFFDRRGLFQRIECLPSNVLIRFFREPLRAIGSFHGQQRFEIDARRRAVRFLGLEGDGAPLRDLQVEAHHRFVNAADLLDVECPVTEALTIEDEQVIEDAEDHTI